MKKSYNDHLKRLFRLNRELSGFISRKKALYFVKLIPTELALVCFMLYLYPQAPLPTTILFGALLCLGAPFVFNPFRVFGNKSYGKITSIELQENLTTKKNHVNLAVKLDVVAQITYQTPKGKLRTVELADEYARCYQVDDEIIFLNALPYPINLTPHDMVACPYCGNIMPAVNKRCLDINCKKLNIYKN